MPDPKQLPLTVGDVAYYARQTEALRVELDALKAKHRRLIQWSVKVASERDELLEESERLKRVVQEYELPGRHGGSRKSEIKIVRQRHPGLTAVELQTRLHRLVQHARALRAGTSPSAPSWLTARLSGRAAETDAKMVRAVIAASRLLGEPYATRLGKHPALVLAALTAPVRGGRFFSATIALIAAAGLGKTSVTALKRALSRHN